MKVLFLCTANSCRSQMAEGILKAIGRDKFEVFSAGAKPSSVHPLAIKVMTEIGIDISHHRSKSVEEFTGQEFDYVITVCGDQAQDVCPVFIGKAKHRWHWNFIDPAEAKGNEEQVVNVFRKVRDEIKVKLQEFIKGLREVPDHEQTFWLQRE